MIKQGEEFPKDYGLLVERVTNLPHKILLHHESHCLPQIVLNYIAHKDCFDLNHAAYFIDNPDFDHFVGVAGFKKDENKFDFLSELWAEPFAFEQKVKDLSFHKKVKDYSNQSFGRLNINHLDNPQHIGQVADQLGIKSPEFFTWNLKHGNHGLLLFEPNNISAQSKRLLKDAASLLGFC